MLAYEISQDQALGTCNGVCINGIKVTLRAVQPGDVKLIEEMHERLSHDSVYYRYLGPNKPSRVELQHLCASDGKCGMCVVATIEDPQEMVIAIACYRVNPDDPSSAEPAVIVEDRFQGCGLGKRITLSLCQAAIQKGLQTFDTYIHPANARVLRLIKGSGMPHQQRYRDGLKEVRVWLSG
ncbi:MAG: GNAT family protein [Anaerolineales bacterium]|jgi:RimJ/RimL family protein N-acetyltransferase